MYLRYFNNTALRTTTWVTVRIAANRYIVVCLPLRASQWCTPSKVKIQLAVVYIVLDKMLMYVWISVLQFDKVYFHVWDVVVMGIVPLFILTLLTIRLIKAMKAHRRMQAEMQRQRSQPDNSMTFALVIVGIVFFICRTPYLIMVVMRRYTDEVYCSIITINNTCNALNSAVNFFVYIIINERFRNVLAETVCSRRSKTPADTNNMMTQSERTQGVLAEVNETRL